MNSLRLIADRIRSKGYRRILDFFEGNPGVPYGMLLKKVAQPVEGAHNLDIPMLALREIHRREAIRERLLREYAKDVLTRSLREHLGKGWDKGTQGRERRALAYSHWSTPSDDLEHLCGQVWEALKQLSPPDDWRPEPTGDKYIDEAFRIGWPNSEDSCDK